MLFGVLKGCSQLDKAAGGTTARGSSCRNPATMWTDDWGVGLFLPPSVAGAADGRVVATGAAPVALADDESTIQEPTTTGVWHHCLDYHNYLGVLGYHNYLYLGYHN